MNGLIINDQFAFKTPPLKKKICLDVEPVTTPKR